MGRGDRFKKIFDRILTSKAGFARDDITHLSVSETLDSLGNPTAVTESSTTITGDFQPVTKDDVQLLEAGLARIGDAKLFLSADTAISANDFLVIDGVRWQLRLEFEPNDVNGVKVAQSWICARVDG